MVPLQRFPFEEDHGEEGEDYQCYHLLYHLQLHEREGAAVAYETNPIGGYLTGVFQQGYSPRHQYHNVEWRIAANDLHLLKLEVSIPCKSHEDIGDDQQPNR
jgi:hypothetical protein